MPEADEEPTDPLDTSADEIGLPAEADGDLSAIRSARERIGRPDWERLRRLDRLRGKLAWCYWAIPCLIWFSLREQWDGDLRPLLLLRKPPARWDAGDRLYAGAWAAAIAVTALAAAGQVLIGARLRRVAEQISPPEMDADEVLGHLSGAAFFEEAREFAREQQQEEEAWQRFREGKQRGPSWWRLELSGAHLLWWVALAIALANNCLRWPGGAAAAASWGALASGSVFKSVGLIGYFAVARSPETKTAVLRYYRWWGRGLWPLAVVTGCALLGANS